MRVLELINTLEEGGAEQITSTLALQLRARGHEVSVVCMRDRGFMPVPMDRFEAGGVEVIALNKPDGFSWAALHRLAEYLRERQIDVIHTHNPVVNHYGAGAARLAGSPIVVSTVHGISTLNMTSWAGVLYRISCEATTCMVSVCDAVRRALRSRFLIPADRCIVIPNGIDVSELSKLPVRSRNGDFVFGTMARLVPVKDHAALMRAFAEVRIKRPNCHLDILGSGELEGALKALARDLRLGTAVQFHGWSSDIAGFLERLDSFVLSSRSEGLPLTLLEAMAAGKAIISTAVGGIPEIIEKARCGWLCPPGNPEALANSMLQAIDSPCLHEIGARGRAVALQFYSVNRMVDNYERLFLTMLDGMHFAEQ
jgi:glycosyltransferase involved in cell wall biosynthesis